MEEALLVFFRPSNACRIPKHRRESYFVASLPLLPLQKSDLTAPHRLPALLAPPPSQWGKFFRPDKKEEENGCISRKQGRNEVEWNEEEEREGENRASACASREGKLCPFEVGAIKLAAAAASLLFLLLPLLPAARLPSLLRSANQTSPPPSSRPCAPPAQFARNLSPGLISRPLPHTQRVFFPA